MTIDIDDDRIRWERGGEWEEADIEDLIATWEKAKKHGYWIKKEFPLPLSDGSKVAYECSCCKTHWDCESNYCPHCGAKMDRAEKTGYWVDHIKDFWCSECGCRILPEQVDSFSRCPQCGSMMRKE